MINLEQPRLTELEREALAAAMSRATRYLEWGMGGSTLMAARSQNLDSIVSLDSDPFWVESVRGHPEIAARRGVSLIHADIGPVKGWGHPADDSQKPLWPNYVAAGWRDGVPDLVFVDGRFRIACALSVLLVAPDAVVLLHDAGRREYQPLWEFFTVDEKVEQLWRLVPRPSRAQPMAALMERLFDTV